jgi:hypothetical protein
MIVNSITLVALVQKLLNQKQAHRILKGLSTIPKAKELAPFWEGYKLQHDCIPTKTKTFLNI